MTEFILGLIAGIALSALAASIIKRLRSRRQDEELPCAPRERREAAPSDFSAGEIVDRPRFVAAVAASIAAYMGSDVSGLRIRSVRRLESGADRRAFVAAVSAAIASAMGTEPSGLRIRSIRRLSGGGDRPQLVAAMSAAIASAMGAEVSGIRIHSIKQK